MHAMTVLSGILAQAPQAVPPPENTQTPANPVTVALQPIRQFLLATPAPDAPFSRQLLHEILAPARPALAASFWTLDAVFGTAKPSTARYDLATDISVADLYEMIRKQEPKNLLVLFHASWCKPCKIFAKPEYQKAIQDFNNSHQETQVVTMRIDNEADPLMEDFYQQVGIIVTKGIHEVTGEEVVDESYAVPSSFLLHTPSGKYARSYKIPKTPDKIELITGVGFRAPEAFSRELPAQSSLKKTSPK